MTPDVLIAGGGLAGSSLAIMLGRAGFHVELFERSHFPREKACGEGLMPAGVGVLQRLGLADAVGGAPFYGIRYHAGTYVAEGCFPASGGLPSIGRGQRRRHLDQVLFAAAAATPGVVARTGTSVEAPLVEQGRVVGLMVAGEPHHASLVVAADGAHSRLRRQLGLDRPRCGYGRVGLRVHFRLAADRQAPPWVEVFLGGGYELYITPLPQGEVLVAALAGREVIAAPTHALLARWIAEQPVLRARLHGAEQITSLRGLTPLQGSATRGVIPGAVLLGDAAGFLDPITGSGMAQALLAAELLAHCIRQGWEAGDGWPEVFERQRQLLLRDYRLLTQLVLGLASHHALAQIAVRLLGSAPALFSYLIGVAGGQQYLPWHIPSEERWHKDGNTVG